MVMFNPSGVDKDMGFVSVGFTYGYSRGGPLRGHNHSTFYTPNFCVAHPSPRPSPRFFGTVGPEGRQRIAHGQSAVGPKVAI